MLERELAETYAGWFRALADATRVQILNLLAEQGEPMTVGQIVAVVPVGQSTVSAHLKMLAEARFVLVERHGPLVPGQPAVRVLLPHRRRRGDGPPGHPVRRHHLRARDRGGPVSTEHDHRDRVRDRYAAAAEHLGSSPAATHYTGETGTDGLPVGVSLGCGNPVAVADLHPGDTVLDLGSGGGLDVLLSARRVGPTGRAIGLDMTPAMLHAGRHHATETGITNAEFLAGHIENIPLPDESVEVVISNCVITLSADKPRVFAEIARVLRPGGRLGVSNVMAEFTLTDADRAAGADRIECLTSSLTTDAYAAALTTAGLTDIELRRGHPMTDKLHAALVRARKPTEHRDTVTVAAMTGQHADQVLAIHQAGLDTGNASFETTAPPWPDWDRSHLDHHRFVALDPDGTVTGWIAATPVSSRCVYTGVLEHSIYIHPAHRGHGIGRTLLDTYTTATEAAGIWTLHTGIFPENTASVALHQHAGFRVVGTRERIGNHHGTWRDVTLIERRSPRTDT